MRTTIQDRTNVFDDRSTLSLASPETQRTGSSGLRRLGLRLLLAPIDRALRIVGPRFRLFFWLIAHTPPRMLDALGRLRAQRAFHHARRRVPGYAAYLNRSDAQTDSIGRDVIPETDKKSYVTAIPIDDRCLDGYLPSSGVSIDESSGSSGTPFNWVRSSAERQATHVFISHFSRYVYGDSPFIAINAFSMGAWATGVNMAVALERNSVVKSTGPDVDKIFSTLEYFGTDRTYLVCGYPPFLKHLMDEAAEAGFPLNEYRLMGMVGGEGMAEGLRDYLSGAFDPVFSGYGATDIEIGLAGETPLSVAIRRLAREVPEVRAALFGSDSRLPMVFQYNPIQHHVQTNESGELVFTINRLDVLAPRIRYNIHDQGGVLRFDEMARLLNEIGVDVGELAVESRHVGLPFMWVFGRSDYTVSIMGANIYPEDVEQALYDAPELAAQTSSFCLGTEEQPDGTIRALFSFELSGHIDEELHAEFHRRIVDAITALNSDFRTAMAEHPDAVRPVIRLHPTGEGPFAGDADKIKQTRLTAPASK